MKFNIVLKPENFLFCTDPDTDYGMLTAPRNIYEVNYVEGILMLCEKYKVLESYLKYDSKDDTFKIKTPFYDYTLCYVPDVSRVTKKKIEEIKKRDGDQIHSVYEYGLDYDKINRKKVLSPKMLSIMKNILVKSNRVNLILLASKNIIKQTKTIFVYGRKYSIQFKKYYLDNYGFYLCLTDGFKTISEVRQDIIATLSISERIEKVKSILYDSTIEQIMQQNLFSIELPINTENYSIYSSYKKGDIPAKVVFDPELNCEFYLETEENNFFRFL